MNSRARKRLLRFPGQSEIAQLTEKWSSQALSEIEIASAIHDCKG